MAEELGNRVRLGSPVTKIEHHDSTNPLVITANGSFRAKQVIVAMMPADADRIYFAPPLPEARATLQRRWVERPVAKAIVVYDRPFWRDMGLIGVTSADSDPISAVMDITPPDRDHGWLGVFFEPASLAPDADPRDGVVPALVALFGDLAAAPVSFHAYDWSTDPWASGCTTALPVGVLTEVPGAAEPVGPIHWAGTETAETWIGCVDGAIRSGQRAATEVLTAISTG